MFIGVCNRLNPANSACSNATGRLIKCLETDDYGLGYACLCSDRVGGTVLTADSNCGS